MIHVPEAPKEETKQVQYNARQFASESFALMWPLHFDLYSTLRLTHNGRESAIEAFEMSQNNADLTGAGLVAMYADANPYVVRRMREILPTLHPKRDMWSINQAVSHMVLIIKDDDVRAITKLQTIQALNELLGFVAIDDGNNRRGNTVADFMKLDADWKSKRQEKAIEDAVEQATAIVKH